jgi:hypothetical protein
VHDLTDQIHSLFETGLLPVAADDIARRDRPITTPFPPRARPAITVRHVTAATVGLVAVGCAAVLVATLVSAAPSGRPARPALLDAAYVRHLAAASRLALAKSGQAVLTLTMTQGQGQTTNTTTNTYHLTFSGANWNEWYTFTETVSGMRWVRSTGTRVVDGQAYLYRDHVWYHVTGPGAVTSMPVSDPRALLAELAPSARFVRAGAAVVDGVSVEHLRATSLTGLPAISLPPPFTLGPARLNHPTALDVWVDDHGVVRRVAWSGMEPVMIVETHGGTGGPVHMLIKSGEIATHKLIKSRGIETSAVVTFLSIGQPQVITVPPNAIPAPVRADLAGLP